jgi:hypothetical protein
MQRIAYLESIAFLPLDVYLLLLIDYMTNAVQTFIGFIGSGMEAPPIIYEKALLKEPLEGAQEAPSCPGSNKNKNLAAKVLLVS